MLVFTIVTQSRLPTRPRRWQYAGTSPLRRLLQTVEQQKFSSALERQRQELDAVLEERLSSELGRQHRQVELHHRQQLEALQTELENEMRQQLRRQAAAHSDHLQVTRRTDGGGGGGSTPVPSSG